MDDSFDTCAVVLVQSFPKYQPTMLSDIEVKVMVMPEGNGKGHFKEEKECIMQSS